ncbi:hypothetical protein [Roseivivax isoporae]|uniref:hypothetical protein n=1 Tax=Roseivivax isoporae TaxID=591206 RepID=UPI0012EC5B47|nr:hypothetical protein [Roseivivax isoporae]
MAEERIGCNCGEAAASSIRSERRLSVVAAVGDLGIWEYQADTGEHTWSTGLNKIFGFPPGGECGFSEIQKLIHPTDQEDFERFITLSRESEEVGTLSQTLRYRRFGESTWRWMSVETRKFSADEGAGARVFAVARETSAEAALDDQARDLLP